MILTSCLKHYGDYFWQHVNRYFSLWAVKNLLIWSRCLWCVTGVVARTCPEVLQSVYVCTCVCVCMCIFLNTQHLCLGCVWRPRPQPNKLQGVWMLNVQGSSACLSLHLCNPLTAEEQHTPLPPFSDCTAVCVKHRFTHILCCCRWLLLMQKTGDHIHEDIPDLLRDL